MEENEIFVFGDDAQSTPDTSENSSAFGEYGYSEEDSPVSDESDYYDEDQNDNYEEESNDADSNYVDQLLLSKGIDKNNIEITEEDGTVSTVNFDQLSDEDKLALLQDEEFEEESPITDSDIEILNYFRANRINSLQEFADGIAQQAISDYIASQKNVPVSEIDNYSDDEVIAYDLIQKFGDDMTDDEIDDEIERLKEDDDAFNKKVQLLRTFYRNSEEAQRRLYEDEQASIKEADTNNFINAYIGAATDLNTIQGIDLEPDDKNDLLDFVLTKDQFGRTEFAKALDNPEAVLRMAWFIKNGEYAAQATRDYFAQMLAKQRAQAAKPAQPKTRAVSRPSTRQPQRKSESNSFKF